jgi:hypothetical protein
MGAAVCAPMGLAADGSPTPSPVWTGDLRQLYRPNRPTDTRLLISYLEQEVSHPAPTATGLGGAPIDSDYRQAQIIGTIAHGDTAVIREARGQTSSQAVRDGSQTM